MRQMTPDGTKYVLALAYRLKQTWTWEDEAAMKCSAVQATWVCWICASKTAHAASCTLQAREEGPRWRAEALAATAPGGASVKTTVQVSAGVTEVDEEEEGDQIHDKVLIDLDALWDYVRTTHSTVKKQYKFPGVRGARPATPRTSPGAGRRSWRTSTAACAG